VEEYLHTLALDGGEWLASLPGYFTPEARTLVRIQYEGGRAPVIWDVAAKRNILYLPGTKHQLSSPQPSHTELLRRIKIRHLK
jgi:hypothetical protein